VAAAAVVVVVVVVVAAVAGKRSLCSTADERPAPAGLSFDWCRVVHFEHIH
jgi:hypothetical protein